MTLEIRAGMFAVLRDGKVVGPMEAGNDAPDWISPDIIADQWRGVWLTDGRADFYGAMEQPAEHVRFDIVSVHATRAEALAYVADNPMNRELYPDGPDLASAPVVVDWKARAEAAEALVEALTEAGWEAWNQASENHDKPPPVKYMAPYGGLVKLHAALVAAAKEPRYE